ncbi:pirin family protein [soil metagenome]
MKTTDHTQLTVRRAGDRFRSKLDWLESYHTFSFGEHYDPAHMGFRSLRVINDDIVAPGKGFGAHPHRAMEIFTYIISGQLAHQDSMGNGRTISAGEFQYMSAGTGVTHSEINPSTTDPVHLLQIWILPNSDGAPRYRDFDTKPLRQQNGLTLLASPDGGDESMEIRQDAAIHIGHLGIGHSLDLPASEDRPYRWLHLIGGSLTVATTTLAPGDAASFHGNAHLKATEDAEFLVFHLA